MKKNKIPLTQFLSESELTWLQNHLETISQTCDNSMTLETVDGLFCALIINPVMAKPVEWMKLVFGKALESKSEADLEKVLMLLIRYWNYLYLSIENYPRIDSTNICFPRLIEHQYNPKVKLAEKWINGFYQGMDYCRKEWDLFLIESDNVLLLSPISTLEKAREIITDENRQALSTQISSTIYALFQYWLKKAEAEKQVIKSRVGRNDPCPCGSGKKYKKCCDV
jgi:uncharacterized protein